MAVVSPRNGLLLVITASAILLLLFQLSAEKRFGRQADGGIYSAVASSASQPRLIVYNRIPKTASTTFMHLPYELCADLGYNVLLLNLSRPQHYLTFTDQVFFARNVTG